jgi:hypothetical protein
MNDLANADLDDLLGRRFGFDRRRTWRVAQLIAALWVLSIADLLFTLWAHHFTPFNEVNPLARALLQSQSFAGLVAMKLGLTGLGAGIFWHLRRYARAEAVLWTLVGVYVLLALRWSNYTVEAMAQAAAY